VPADDEASDLTRSADIICGVHKLRAHKLRRDVSMHETLAEEDADGADHGGTGEGGGGGEGRTLDDELMEQLRAVKIQELLSGAAAAEGPSDDSDGGAEDSAPSSRARADFLSSCDDSEEAASNLAPAPSRGRAADESHVPSSRPTSSTDVTPTQTPDSPHKEALPSPGHSRSPQKGRLGQMASRMSSKPDGAPPVLRHLRMPADASLADSAAEILSLN